jgi:hypothetical protein
MRFSDKATRYFKGLGLSNRDIAKRMDNYSESLVSRYLQSDKVSATFVLKIKKYFPDADVDSWMSGNMVQEPGPVYQVNPIKRINKIIEELEKLKEELKENSQK